MHEAQFGRVQGQAWGAALIGRGFFKGWLAVEFIAADGVAGFGEMDTDLVGAAGF